MGQINIVIRPTLKELQKKFNSIRLQEYLQQEITKFAFLAESFAKQLTPVDTGRLRASIGITETRPIGAVVSTNVNYAIFVHEGTSRMRSRPFMEQGAEFAKRRWEGQIGDRIEEHITRKFKKL